MNERNTPPTAAHGTQIERGTETIMTTPAFEALDVSQYLPPEELPEVKEVKDRIVKVAKQYTDRHGWCDAVQAALKEAGIVPSVERRFDVDLGPLGTSVLVLDPMLLHGKTAQQQAKVVAKAIDHISISIGKSTTTYDAGSITDFVTGISIHEDNPAMLSTMPSGAWMVLPNGKASHLFHGFYAEGTSWLASACDAYGDYRESLKEPTASSKRCSRCATVERQTS